MTTIKVPAELRDELKRQAAAERRTLAQHLARLSAQEARRMRFDEMREAMRRNPPDEDYLREAEEWTGPGWL